jgi:hypothetical protein
VRRYAGVRGEGLQRRAPNPPRLTTLFDGYCLKTEMKANDVLNHPQHTPVSSLADPISASLAALLERLKPAIAEFGYAAVADDLISADLVGGEDSLLGSDDVMVVPGHLADAARPILLAVTRGWAGKEPLAFAKILRQVKAWLIEANQSIKVVVVFCDAWDSASFQQEHREELNAHSMNGVRFLFMLVGVPESTPIPVPVGLKGAPK